MSQSPWSRRQFLQFIGATGGAISISGLAGCGQARKKPDHGALGFQPLAPSYEDQLLLAEGLKWDLLISYGDPIGKGVHDKFGYNNDYTAFIPFDASSPNEGWLWVNHESTDQLFTLKRKKGDPLTKSQVRSEMHRVGGSLLHVSQKQGQWKVIKNSRHNTRYSALTKIPFAAGVRVKGTNTAVGTLANCAGGVTPWGTFLTCEENYQDYYGETIHHEDGKQSWTPSPNYLQWEKFFKHPPEHYGWVVEIDPKTKKAKKHTSMGRFSHESATVTTAPNGSVVVYSGDDKADEYIYKFISDSKSDLDKGTLFVADTKKGRWLPLDLEKSPELKKTFKTQLDVLIRCREAASILGATPQNRPEDIEILPNGDVLVCLTNNKSKGNFTGEILKIQEKDGDPTSLEFSAGTLITGGEDSGFACPDNMVLDAAGNLWFTTDISGGSIGKAPYEAFGNNALFYVPMKGLNAGFAFRVASAPVGAEFTGPCFSPDGDTLFLSVQHPGEKSKSYEKPHSRWPFFKDQLPKPSVVTIQGPLLNKLTT